MCVRLIKTSYHTVRYHLASCTTYASCKLQASLAKCLAGGACLKVLLLPVVLRSMNWVRRVKGACHLDYTLCMKEEGLRKVRPTSACVRASADTQSPGQCCMGASRRCERMSSTQWWATGCHGTLSMVLS